jgi:hypothetical protein
VGEQPAPPSTPEQPQAGPPPAAQPSYGAQPSVPFPLQEGERVIQVFRRHWWFLWPRTIFWLIVAIAPVAAIAWAFDAAGWLDNVGRVFWIIAAVWLLYWAARLLLNWYRYSRDLWTITNQRIVDSIQPNPFRLHVSTADLVNIQDMTVQRDGVFASILNFGDVLCQTAGSIDFTLSGVPKPQEIQLLVDRERDRERMRYR